MFYVRAQEEPVVEAAPEAVAVEVRETRAKTASRARAGSESDWMTDDDDGLSRSS